MQEHLLNPLHRSIIGSNSFVFEVRNNATQGFGICADKWLLGSIFAEELIYAHTVPAQAVFVQLEMILSTSQYEVEYT